MMKQVWVLSVLVTVIALAGGAAGQRYMDFTGAGSDWNTASNWTVVTNVRDPNDPNGTVATTPPDANDFAYVRDAKTVSITTGTAYGLDVTVGGTAYRPGGSAGPVLWRDRSTLVVAGGTFALTGGSVVGTDIQGGGTLRIADVYDGRMIQSSGVVKADRIEIGIRSNVVYSDPNHNGTPVGTYVMNGGLLTCSDVQPGLTSENRKTRLYVGRGGSIGTTYQAGSGTFIMNDGFVGTHDPDPNTSPDFFKLYVYVANDPNSTGYFEQNGGSMIIENLAIGGGTSTGKGVMNDGYLYLRDKITVNGEDDSFTVKGGTVSVSSWEVGRYATNSVTINAGTVNVRGGGINVGSGRVYTGGSLQPGFGTMYINQTDPNKPTIVTLGGSSEGWIGSGSNTEKGSQYAGTAVPSEGIVNINSGTVYSNSTAAGGGLIIGNARLNGGVYDYNTQARGTLNVLGGSFIGGSGSNIIMAAAPDTTGLLKISKDAYFHLEGKLTMYSGGTFDPSTGRVDTRKSTLVVEVGPASHTQITTGVDSGELTLAGTLRVETGNYRPKEGDKYLIIDSGYVPPLPEFPYFVGDFAAVESNIANGLQHSDPNDPNTPLLPAFAGDIDEVYNPDKYWAIFQGLTAGDANGDHKVGTGDLALMATSWLQGSKAWGNGDFTGDGTVGTGDLALLATNWLWTKPSPAPPAPGESIPEPATLALLGLGGLALIRRKR